MAKKKQNDAVNDAQSAPLYPKTAKDIILQCRTRYKYCIANPDERRNRQAAIEDLKFVHVPGEQWEYAIRKARGKDRPMYEFNNVRITIKNIVNDIRANRPQPKIRATEDAHKETADTMEGLFRNCWAVSDGDTVMDYTAEYQVASGMGAFRVSTEYSCDEAFDQDIVFENIRNPFTLFADPGCADPQKRDAMYWILTDKMKKSTYEDKWPDKKVVSFQSEDTHDDNLDWFFDEGEGFVRVCEYWWKEPKHKKIVLLATGETIDLSQNELPSGAQVVKEREVRGWQIMTAIVSGEAVLEGPTEWAGSLFPFIVVYGEYLVIDGHVYWYGLTRYAKDPQRAHNQALTGVFESIAAAPQAKYWATAKQAEGHVTKWAEAHDKNFPFMLYNPDATAPGPPQRMGPADVPAALIQASQMSTDALKSATGIFDPSIGRQSNVTSGIALRSQTAQGKVATFNYSDNMGKAMQYAGEIFIDLAPKIYDTQRIVRILGADGQEKYAQLYQEGPDGKILNDLGRGKYDITVTVGPNFATQRQEAVESYGQIAQTNPQLWQVAGDLLFKAMDLPYSDQIAERMQSLLPPQIQATLNQGKQVPPEVQQMMAQAQQAMQQVQQQGQLVQAASQELEQLKQQNAADKAGVQTAIANLKTEEAKFNTMKAQFETEVVKAQAEIQSLIDKLAMSEQSQQQAAQISQDIDTRLATTAEAINSQTQGFLQQAADYLQQVGTHVQNVGTQVQQQTQAAAQPKQRTINVKRQNGQLVGQISDGTNTQNVSITRTPDGLQGSLQ